MLIISVGLTLLVAGETQFNMLGFAIVMTASALSGLRWTITQVLLQGSAEHGEHLMKLGTFKASVIRPGGFLCLLGSSEFYSQLKTTDREPVVLRF